jgi:AraC family transcriptional regulator
MPELQSSEVLVETPLVRVYEAFCREPRSAFGASMLNPVAQIGLPRRGLFLMKLRGKEVVVDPNTALVLGAEDEYRVGHPVAGGDQSIVLTLPPHLIEDAIGTVKGRVGSLTPPDRLAITAAARTLRHGQLDQLEGEEVTLLLLGSLSRAFGRRMRESGLGPAQRRRVEQVRALLASAPSTRWDLGRIGRELSCSPFHLARQFRAGTGETISRYILRLRLAMALNRLAEGERNITAIAFDTGFAHHSHFTARFHRAFGITPTQARELLVAPKLESFRALVTQQAALVNG